MDVYKLIASRLFQIPIEEVTEEQKKVAKTSVYRHLYGGSTTGDLSDSHNPDGSDAYRVQARNLLSK